MAQNMVNIHSKQKVTHQYKMGVLIFPTQEFKLFLLKLVKTCTILTNLARVCPIVHVSLVKGIFIAVSATQFVTQQRC